MPMSGVHKAFHRTAQNSAPPVNLTVMPESGRHTHVPMPDAVTPYTKSFDDELDWKLLEQLHSVVSQISSFCFETKKFCVTTEFVVLALFAKFTSDKLDHSLFVTGLIIPLCFWFLDAVGYYYQVKIRGTMESIRLRLKTRNSQPILAAGGEPVIAQDRAQRHWSRRVTDAFFNHSMWLYGLMIAIDALMWILFATSKIA